MSTVASLRDPVTGQTLFIVGVTGHEIDIEHRPRVPVQDIPGKQGDTVQYLGRKSRVGRVKQGVVNGSLQPGVTGGLGLGVANPLVVTTPPGATGATGSLVVPNPIMASEQPSNTPTGAVNPLGLAPIVPTTTPTATPTVTVT